MLWELSKRLAAEFLGSMFLVAAAVSPIILFGTVLGSPPYIALLADAIAVAFVLCALIEIFCPISGAHFNPLVTLVVWLKKEMGIKESALYVVVQVLGGFIGILITHLMFRDYVGGLVFVSEVARDNYNFIGEIVGSFILIFVILMLVETKSTKTSIIVGLLVGGQIMATSSTFFANPQVTIARMFTNSDAGIRPISGLGFITMQFIGALLAYGAYKFFASKKKI